jgi:CRISPR-associated exonuclease Cas4
MTDSVASNENPGTQDAEAPEPLPLSLLNDYLYCPRRAALKVVEGRREANVHTERGDVVHEHSDLAGYEVAHGVTLLRALPVWSDRLGLNGKCDIVERHPDGGLYPVEFKVGRRRQWENDDAQLCAQALCLEEMFGRPVPSGAVFHAESKRRRQVEFTPELRRLTADAVAALHALATPQAPDPRVAAAGRGQDARATLAAGPTVPGPQLHPSSFILQPSAFILHPCPPAVFKPACKECSLYGICLPELAGDPDGVTRAAQALFKT